jgi:LuxR family transcriptional regulator, maltose regulon positive regulatory protein
VAGPLLDAKIHLPGRRRALVARPRLVERLDRGAALTLVSAPAGFGKTTLLADWLAGGRRAAWLSLDHRDNDPTVFWTYVVAALSAVAPLSPFRPPVDSALTTLVNDLGAVRDDVVLVLDDYHLVDAREVHDGMAFLLEHLPPRVHLVIAGRADPPLPLARLRGGGELVEVRAADLRFTAGEAAAYLNGAMGLALTARDVTALEGRTEGWIAALQLAALSMQGRTDVTAFIEGFAGDDRYIVDYLTEEVLARQPDEVRDFLLRTSVLDRLSGPLCDAVTGRDGGQARLVELERENLFVVPLDHRRRWYRYHRLFADVVAAHLLDERPGEVPDLHRRAGAWHERHGEPSEAIRHALAGGDVERAADLVEREIPALSRNRQEAAALGWLAALPDEVVRARPVLTVALAGVLLMSGEVEGVEDRLRDAEDRLAAPPHARVVADAEGLRRLPAMIAVYRAAHALACGDLPGTVGHARRALDLSPPDDHLQRAAASGLLGLASWTTGELDAAHDAWAGCTEGLRRAGHLADTFGCAIAMGEIRLAQGRAGEALRTYEQALRRGTPALRGSADMHVGMAEIHLLRGDPAAAARQVQRSEELGELAGLPQNRYRQRVAAARIREAEGDPDGALALLDEAERVYAGDFFPEVRPVAAVRARVWITQGRWGEALGWARERGLTADDELSYLHEFEHVTLARALLARDGATPLLERLRQAAEAGARTGTVIEVLALQALAHRAQGDAPAALAALRRAVELAEPEGYVRVFADEGPPMAALLRAVAKQGVARGHVRRLLAAAGSRPVDQDLVDPLSGRELDVLRLLRTDLDGPGIARRLGVSLNTVRTHTQHVYAKLGVTNRRAAVRRAAEIDLL